LATSIPLAFPTRRRLLDKLKKPRLLVAYAFDIVPPQTREFFEACRTHASK